MEDRTDGKLVHLDGLNLSRASALYRFEHNLVRQICLLFKSLVSCQEAGRARLHQKLIEGKPQDFVGPLSALDRGDPKCIDLFRSLSYS